MITDTLISLYYPFLLSVSFSLVLPAMINLFKRNIHSIFTFTTTAAATTTTTTTAISELGLLTATEDVESAKLKTDLPPPGGKDWIDGTGGGLVSSCTESLGFESSDEIHSKNVDGDGDGNDDDDDDDQIWQMRRTIRAEGRGNQRKLRSFPPPLSSLNRNGKPSFFLRPVRKDGRLELTEVRIHRSEILHASRHDGRLTLHLIPDQVSLEEIEEEEEEIGQEEYEIEQEENEEQEEEELVEEEELEEEIVLDDDEKEEEIECEREERVTTEWGFHEGLRRCHEMVNQHHHHHHNHVHVNHHQMCRVGIV